MSLDWSQGDAVPAASMATPGILSVTLHEAADLSIREDYRETHNNTEHDHRTWGQDSLWCQKCNLPYAIVIYEKSEAFLECYAGTAEHPLWPGKRRWNTRDFDASFAGELLIYLYLRGPDPDVRQPDVYLGFARARPFDADNRADSRWFTMEQGTGSIRISFEYKATGDGNLEDSDFAGMKNLGESFSGGLAQVKKEVTGRIYVEKLIALEEEASQLKESIRQRSSEIRHPFIVNVAFTYLSDWALHILRPCVGGGHLFHLVQTERRLDVDSCRFYAAEIICALEYLHNVHNLFCWMKPRNVLLDATGHVVLSGLRPFIPNADAGRHGMHLTRQNSEPKSGIAYDCVEKGDSKEHYSIRGTTEYPAPELLLTDQGESKAGDWWALGIFIYEMLTGLPPFYDQDPDRIRENILDNDVQFPESIPLLARDLVSKLLERSPEKRLGTLGGATEIKDHPFFSEINWHQVPFRLYTPPFKPRPTCGVLKQHGVRISLDRSSSHAFSFGSESMDPSYYLSELCLNVHSPASETHHGTIVTDNNWDLLWESGQFQFYNRATNIKQAVPTRATCAFTLTDDGSGGGIRTPSLSQKLDALEAALLAGYFPAVVQLLHYEIDLSVKLFGNQQQTPLQWAVEHDNLEFVQLFLDHDSSPSCYPWEVTLTTAVKNGSRGVIEALLPGTDRISSTIALGVAVSRRQIATAKLLLERGVRCDFEDGDRPLPGILTPITTTGANSRNRSTSGLRCFLQSCSGILIW